MSVQERYRSLERRRADLEHEIEAEGQRPSPDTIKITTLKKQKLRIKEEMTHLSA